MKYACSSCGSCCKRVGDNIDVLKGMGFPYSVKLDGKTCEKFDEETRLCTIYATRPDLCNVETMYYMKHDIEATLSGKNKTKKEVFLAESKICNSWIRQDGLDEKYLVDEKQYE